jgi:predicted RNA-binding Zn-ribbon protein involved in translation (DUF1610 family)
MTTRRRKPKPAPKRKIPKGKWTKLKCPKCSHVIWRKPGHSNFTKCYECGFNGVMVPG